jgi:hypothetical protein
MERRQGRRLPLKEPCSRVILAACLVVATTQSGLAGLSLFVDDCIASADDFSRLGAQLQASGMKEVDPSEGPQFAVPSPERRRLWTSRSSGGAQGEAFTGYVAKSAGEALVEICWHLSRPGESAAIALPELKRRYPPTGGAPERAPYFFYGGYEQWETRINDKVLTIGVNWPVQGDPSAGSSMLYVATVRTDRPQP